MDEAARHELFERLRGVIGDEAAGTVMVQLPPFDWTQIAMKRDLEGLERSITTSVRAEFHRELDAAITSQTRTMMFTALGSSLATGTLVLAATQLP
jgi:hypothetical protein